MSGLLKTTMAVGAALMLSMSPATAKELGVFQTTDRKMDFELTTCGSGSDLCVKLTAARGSAATPRVKKLIGKLVVNQAKAAGNNIWQGTMNYGDYDLNGRMKLSPGKSFVISGCAMIIMCDDINLIPER